MGLYDLYCIGFQVPSARQRRVGRRLTPGRQEATYTSPAGSAESHLQKYFTSLLGHNYVVVRFASHGQMRIGVWISKALKDPDALVRRLARGQE